MAHRIVIWGPGNVGTLALRSVVAHPGLELAGVIVHNPEKEGRDAGVLAGIGETGVVATRDVERALGTRPDAVVYAANQDFRPVEAQDDMVRCLEAGVSVVTPGLYALLHPPSAPPELADRFASAARKGGSSFLCSGIDPGFALDLLPMVLSGVCESYDEIRIIENFNYAKYEVPAEVKAIIGFGTPMDQPPLMLLPGIPQSVWGPALRVLADALDLEIEEIREKIERHPIEKTVDTPSGRIEVGTQGAFRFEVQAVVDGRAALVLEHVTRIVDDTAPQWPSADGQGFHRVQITGRPNIQLTIESEGAGGDHVEGGNATAAARLVNAIPWLCAEPRGLVSGADLPLIVGRGRLSGS